MSACTKFKIASTFSFSGPRVQRFSTGNSGDGGSNNGKKPVKSDALECSKDAGNTNCFVSSANAKYMEYLFSKWIRDPKTVHASWHHYFTEFLVTQDNVSEIVNSAIPPKVKEETQKENITCEPDEAQNESEYLNYLDIQAKRREANAPKTITESLEKQQKSNNPTDLDTNGINEHPPWHKTDCVLGHIILSPNSEPTSSSTSPPVKKIAKLKKVMPKRNICKNKAEMQQPIDQVEHQKTMQRVKAALERDTFSTRREYIKKQLEIIAKKKMEKSLAHEKQEWKDYKPGERPRK